MKKLPIVGVMGSGRAPQTELAHPLGQALARLPVHLLTGGGYGVMHSVSEGFTSVEERKGMCIGIVPTKEQPDGTFGLTSPSYPNRFVEIAIVTPLGVYNPANPDAITRNYANIQTSDLVIALPGGHGTRQEVDLALKFKKAVIAYGPSGSFEDYPTEMPRTDSLQEVVDWVKDKITTNRPAPAHF